MSAAYEVLLDAHVHYHPCFSVADFCSAAVRNLRAGAVQLGLDEATLGGLMFTESRGDNAFEAMRKAASSEPPADLAEDRWWLRTSNENNSLWAFRGGSASERLLLVAGRQDDSGLEYKDIGAKTVHEIFIADPRTRVTLDETRERYRMTVMSKEAAQPEVA